MSNITIFKDKNAVATGRKRELSDLTKALTSSNISTKRIQTNTNGTFKRMVNGEQIGKSVRGELNVIVINALPKVSRTFYENKYDPDGEATLPDCWSNLGDKPEPAAENPQAANCGICPQNVAGSGGGQRRACRFSRRIAVLVEGDTSGDIYQLNIPSKSLFGKGVGNSHPFESYARFLAANGYSIENVITNVRYNDEAETMELVFSPMRELTDEEVELVEVAVADPEAARVVSLTVAAADGVTKKPKAEEEKPAPKAKIMSSDEPTDDDEPAPTVRTKKPAEAVIEKPKLAKVISDWGEDD